LETSYSFFRERNLIQILISRLWLSFQVVRDFVIDQDRAVAMLAIDGSRSLLGHDNELPTKRWKNDIAAHHYNSRARIWALAFVATILLIPLTIFSILYLQWQSAFESPGSKLTKPLDPVLVTGPDRDLKLLLHPEDHVSRESGIINFSWNITKAKIAPNGVEKDVFLINGTANCALLML
jgi:hypothetical protein